MEENKTKFPWRLSLIVNFTSILLLIIVFEILKKTGPDNWLVFLEILFLAIAIVSFMYAFVMTGLYLHIENIVPWMKEKYRLSTRLFDIRTVYLLYLFL